MPDIFYIEDDPDYTDIVETALNQIDSNTTVASIDVGTAALQTLNQLAEEKKLPKLVLLDWNLPDISGLDVLRRIKGTQALRQLPVIVFSTSDNPRDIHSSLEFGANAYVTKPLGYISLLESLKAIHHFWLKTATAF